MIKITKLMAVLFLLMDVTAHTAYAEVVSSTYYENNKKTHTYKYFWEGDRLIKCNQKNKNDCALLYRKTKDYCKNLLQLKDEDEMRSRERWECPVYKSINILQKEYKISLPDDVIAFTDYTFNLIKLIKPKTIVKYGDNKSPRTVKFGVVNMRVGVSPNNIYIPFDIHDIIFGITIKFDIHNRVISEKYDIEIYKTSEEQTFLRQYIYQDNRIIKIIELTKNQKGKVINKIVEIFEYDK